MEKICGCRRLNIQPFAVRSEEVLRVVPVSLSSSTRHTWLFKHIWFLNTTKFPRCGSVQRPPGLADLREVLVRLFARLDDASRHLDSLENGPSALA